MSLVTARLNVALALCGLVAAVFWSGPAPSAQATPAITTLGVADRVNQHVSAASSGKWVALTWAATSDTAGADVYAVVSADGGATFGTPARVNTAGRPASISGEQPPRVALVPGAAGTPTIVVVWTAKAVAGAALLAARSTDGGRTFATPAPVSGAEAAGNRGWESIAVDARGTVYVTWLDHRDTASQGQAGHAMHQHGAASSSGAAADGAARAQRSQLFVGALDSSLPGRGIARGVCYCCKTAIAAAPDGAIYTAWRHVYAGNHRDIAFAVSRDRGRSFTEPVRVSADHWQLDGCPENGPSLAVDRRNRVFVLWPTLVKEPGGEALRLFLSSTTDGAAFAPRTPLPTASAAYHPQLVAAPDGSLFAAWDEVEAGQPRRVRLARVRPDDAGAVRFDSVALPGDLTGSYPALAVTPGHVVVAWTRRGSPSSIAVHRVPLQHR